MSIWRFMATGGVGVLACFGGASVSPVAATDCFLAPSSLVAWWPMNGGTGNIRSNSVELVFGNPMFVAGKVAGALQFDGFDDRLQVVASPSTDIAGTSGGRDGSFAVEFWFRTTNGGSQPILYWSGDFPLYGVGLSIIDWRLHASLPGHAVGLASNPTGYDLAAPFGTIRSNVFHHVVLRHLNISGQGFAISLWVDGRVVASRDVACSDCGFFAQTSFNLNMGSGQLQGGAVARFKGEIDEVTLYSGRLGDEEIISIFEAGADGKCLSCPGAPEIVASPVDTAANNGTGVTFDVGVIGPKPYFYQWKLNGTNLPNANVATYSIPNVQLDDAGNYSVVVSNLCGAATSSVAALTVFPSPQITSQPRDRCLLPGEVALLHVQATGPSLSYLWQHEGSALHGETNATLTISNAHPFHAGNYSVLVSNSYGSSISRIARLGVGTNVLDCDRVAFFRTVRSGGYYAFAGDAVIIITNSLVVSNDVTIDATGHDVVLSGGHTNRLFKVNPGVRCSLVGLTIADGKADRGGAIMNDGGVLDLRQVTFRGNQAVSPGNANGPEALGGAIFNTNGTVLAARCRWEDNSALGANASIQFIGFTSRRPSSAGRGGAIFNAGGTVRIEGSLFRNNLARGGNGISDMSFAAAGSDGEGGAINNRGSMVVLNSTFDHNGALGGTSQNNAAALFSLNGLGGGIASLGDLLATNCTLSGNYVQGGTNGHAWPGTPADGEGRGGGLYAPAGSVALNHVSLSGNNALPSQSGAGKGASIFAAGSVVRLINSILVSGHSRSNCFGALIDDGHNISSDASCNFTNVSSLNNTDPRLGPLADNGGLTPTLALLPGSPAINAADDTTCATMDQRGVFRPQFGKCDIGAFEARLADLPPVLVASTHSPQVVTLLLHGAPGVEYRLLSSGGLASWSSIATNVTDASGATSFSVPAHGVPHFYRAIMP